MTPGPSAKAKHIGFVQRRGGQSLLAGRSRNTSTDTGLNIDYTLFRRRDVGGRETGWTEGAYTASDVFTVAVVGTAVSYYRTDRRLHQ